ncbi:uncharacterized protein LOC119898317 [Micropterus salmoides]|uniref:uncharacterized protein LOC119898317 n=1 Tax=Micropterus salmoides TaxID=27706 RepID=UPI0018ED9DBC|nr:uncharacterized protein LOC119898317 [Micropterus salmoides]
MAAAQEELRRALLAVLPDLPADTLTTLMAGLEELGVENKEDVSLLSEENLLPFLRVVQSRKLLRAFSSQGSFSALSPPGSPQLSSTLSPVGSPQLSSPETPRTSNPMPSPRTPWPVHFKVNWEKMTPEIQSAIANSTRPNPAARRVMVRELVDQMRVHNANPNRGICLKVVNDIIQKYPTCFGDVDDDENTAGASLVQQVKTRIEHVNRNNTLARLRKNKHSNRQARTNGRGPVDQYGCVRWAPQELPSGETDETLQEMKTQMQQLYAQEGMSGMERGALQRWLQRTYILQRCDLNADPPHSVSKIKDDWPFLFSLKGLFSHFSELTGIPIQEKLPAAIDNRSQNIIEYFQQQKTPGVGKVLEAYDEESGNKAICTIMCLLAHFKEGDGIFLTADPSATAADIERAVSLPSTPRLVVPGEILRGADMWVMSMEGACVMGPHSNLLHGLAAVFAAYYVFNLQYPAEAASTLEFIQRAFCGINPQTGSKAEKRRGLNAPVCTLLRKLLDFELVGRGN